MKNVRESIVRLLELPRLLDEAGARTVAMRAEKRQLERRIKLAEARLRLGVYSDKDLKSDKVREAALVIACEADTEWLRATDRMEQLQVGIDKTVNQYNTLDHERKALKATLEREYASILQEALSDKQLAKVITGGGVHA